MTDNRHLNNAYFIDLNKFNCPFCGMKSVAYSKVTFINFNTNNNKINQVIAIKCNACAKISLHFSKDILLENAKDMLGYHSNIYTSVAYEKGKEFDKHFYHHIPSSFFTLDERIPKKIRELFSEAQECKKANFKTGASACLRKAIYTLIYEQLNLIADNKENEFKSLKDLGYLHYSDCIKKLKEKFTNIDSFFFEEIENITGITSDQVHESSWEEITANDFDIFLLAFKEILEEIYIKPAERKERRKVIEDKKQAILAKNNEKK